MMPVVTAVLLAVSSSLAASILVKVTVIMALALAAARLARRARAAARHVLLAAAFVVLLVLPIASIVAPSVRVAVPVARQEAPRPAPVDMIVDAVISTAPAHVVFDATPPTHAAPGALLFAAILAAWIAGAVLFLLPVMVGLTQVRSLRRSAVRWSRGQLVVDALAGNFRIRRRVDVLLHESVPGPMTCGVVRPAIVLPTDARTWPEADLERAVVHELEHVRRGDWVSQCVARAVCACYWFHPLVWIARRQLMLNAERACDDAVLRRSDATAYAHQLVVLAKRLRTAPNPPVLAMANRADLVTRVIAVLDSRQRRGRAGARWVGLASAVSLLLVTTMSPLRIVASVSVSTSGTAPTDKAGQGSAPTTNQAAPDQSPKQRYDVASVKPCQPEPDPPDTGGGPRGTAGGTNARISPGRFVVPCVTLEQLIYLAYASYGARPAELLANDYLGTASDATKVRGGPAWVHSQGDKFAIEATAPGVSDRTVLMGAMLRTLLEERFRLVVHRESEDVSMYALRVAKAGLKLTPMKESDCDPATPGGRSPCGFMTNSRSGPNTRWHYVGFQLGFLARQLAGPLGRHVIDETGVSGMFIIDLDFSMDTALPPGGDPAGADAATLSTPLFTALEQQLGLKLEKITGPRGYLVVDRAEKPTPDSPSALSPPPSRAMGAGPGR